MFQLVTKRIC